MPDLFEQVIAEAALLAAWREVQVNDLEDGKVNEQVAAYSRDLFANLASLQSGTCRPDPVYAMEIPKWSGGKRLIAVPAVADRIVERALTEVQRRPRCRAWTAPGRPASRGAGGSGPAKQGCITRVPPTAVGAQYICPGQKDIGVKYDGRHSSDSLIGRRGAQRAALSQVTTAFQGEEFRRN